MVIGMATFQGKAKFFPDDHKGRLHCFQMVMKKTIFLLMVMGVALIWSWGRNFPLVRRQALRCSWRRLNFLQVGHENSFQMVMRKTPFLQDGYEEGLNSFQVVIRMAYRWSWGRFIPSNGHEKDYIPSNGHEEGFERVIRKVNFLLDGHEDS